MWQFPHWQPPSVEYDMQTYPGTLGTDVICNNPRLSDMLVLSLFQF